MACGHLYDNVDQFDDTTTYHQRNIVLRNLGNGKFADVTAECGALWPPRSGRRGVAFADLDNSGYMDVVILNSREAPRFCKTCRPAGNHWIEIRLQGVKTNRDGVGAPGQGRGRRSGADRRGPQRPRLPEPLGDASALRPWQRDRIDRIEVHWIGGGGGPLRERPRGSDPQAHRGDGQAAIMSLVMLQ